MLKPRMRFKRFLKDIVAHTPFIKLVTLLIVSWLVFSWALFISETSESNTPIKSYGDALYWGVAAFSTAGIANPPVTGIAQAIGAIWIVTGSVIFFGAIVATITSYFMRPMQRPHKRIIDTIEYNLEQLDDLNSEELDLLKQTTDALIENVERIKRKQTGSIDTTTRDSSPK